MSSYKDTPIHLERHRGFMKGVEYMITPENKQGFNQGIRVGRTVYRELIAPVISDKVNGGLNELREFIDAQLTSETLVNICNMDAEKQEIERRKIVNGMTKLINNELGDMLKGMLEMSDYLELEMSEPVPYPLGDD